MLVSAVQHNDLRKVFFKKESCNHLKGQIHFKNFRIWSSERKVTFPKSCSLSEVKLEFWTPWSGHSSGYSEWPHGHPGWGSAGNAPPQERSPPKKKNMCLLGGWFPSLPPSLGKPEAYCQFHGFSCPCFRVATISLARGVSWKEGEGFAIGVCENSSLSPGRYPIIRGAAVFFPQAVYSCWAPPGRRGERMLLGFPSREEEPPNVKVWGIFGCWGWEIGRSVVILELILQNRQWSNWLIHCFPLRLHFCGFSCGNKSSEGWWYNIGERMLEPHTPVFAFPYNLSSGSWKVGDEMRTECIDPLTVT